MKKNNLSQDQAINFVSGPCLVVSGPGSGKTYVLTNRIFNLIANCGVPPKNILVITFTKAAGDEMKRRFIKLTRENDFHLTDIPHFGTFHSIFFKILREDFGYNLNSLITDSEARTYIKSIVTKYGNIRNYKDIEGKVLKEISNYKLARERGDVYIPEHFDLHTFKNILIDYKNILCIKKKLDFPDMIDKCHELLLRNKGVLKKYQEIFKYILVDEFQDINKSEYDVVKLLCKTNNIFVVGDDDQSIYSFRGSRPGVMKDFENDYKGTKKIYLDINYRSKDNIVSISKKLIDHNKKRLYKNLNANDKTLGKIAIKKFIDSRDEDNYIINLINKYRNLGFSFSDIAILYRTNQLSYSIQNDLMKNGIPYKVKEENDIYLKTKKRDSAYERIRSDAVNLMTFHISKGLEFKVVIIIDANDGICPHKKSIKDFDIETERRLLYVAMTRAKEYLHIFFTIRRFGKNYKASRFILEAIGE